MPRSTPGTARPARTSLSTPMRVLVACEFSGIVRDAFRKLGHDAWSCDLLPCEADPQWHIQGDVMPLLGQGWDLMIAHPPCTDLAVSGARWFKKKGLPRILEAADFFKQMLWAPIPKICLENPVSVASRLVQKPTQEIHPWQFGHEAEKTTWLWLVGLPALKPTKIVDKGEQITFASGRKMSKWYYERWGDGHTLSVTFPGIANAMAEQWGSL